MDYLPTVTRREGVTRGVTNFCDILGEGGWVGEVPFSLTICLNLLNTFYYKRNPNKIATFSPFSPNISECNFLLLFVQFFYEPLPLFNMATLNGNRKN